MVVTEGVSSDEPIWDYVEFDQPGGGRRHLISSGGSLGWGVGAGVGAKLGAPGKQVAVLVGDGSFQFAVQALWTAVNSEIPAIFVICNNASYRVLKVNMNHYHRLNELGQPDSYRDSEAIADGETRMQILGRDTARCREERTATRTGREVAFDRQRSASQGW